MSALDSLSLRNGLKTTSTVLGKQQSGLDAAQKANPQEAAAQMNMNTAQAMLHGKEASLTTPKDAHDQAVRMNQETVEGMLHSQTQMKKQEDPQQEEKPRQMSYAEMFKMLNPEETPEQKARRERRERAKMRIAAIGDGLRALSNMYFATKGAKVVHDPKSDLTVVNQKRLEALKGERDKNKSAWLNGYLKAQALDEEARKNKENLAEQVRYHDQLAKNRERVGDQKDRSLDQKDRQLDLTKYKYDTEADYKKLYLAIKKAESDGRISHWQAMEAIGRMNAETGRVMANKTGSSRSGSYSGEIDEYMDLMDQDPQGMKDAEKEVRKMGMSVKTAAGRKAQKIAYKKKHGGSKGAQASGGNKGGSSSSKGGKKSTGVEY